MNTLRAAIVPGLIAGVVSLFTSWFWMGLVFHRYQRATPETWRTGGTAELRAFQPRARAFGHRHLISLRVGRAVSCRLFR